MILSPKCVNDSMGGGCGYCGKCGREFKYFTREDGQPILHIVKPSIDDAPNIIGQCDRNKTLKDLAEPYKVKPKEIESTDSEQLVSKIDAVMEKDALEVKPL